MILGTHDPMIVSYFIIMCVFNKNERPEFTLNLNTG